ncbi:uncharacterized protein LOC128876373 [Hylaeus volcanicus]|uniref:uncharacterized protein LOC128876373 n=1 Tax=Hylaeus volcanicus TaxID=313075 RepID=UPI0023B823C5|nr:uncharacterized protein LOC128876373 [Hylaeus volcanicus]
MENSGAVMIEGEDYEVVDECIKEEDVSNTVQNKPTENSANVGEPSKDAIPVNDKVPNENVKQDEEPLCIDLTDDVPPNNLSINNNDRNSSSNVEIKRLEQANTENKCLEQPNAEEKSLEQANAKNKCLEQPNPEEKSLEQANAENKCLEQPNAEEKCLEQANAENKCLEQPNAEEKCLEQANGENKCLEESNAENKCLEQPNEENECLEQPTVDSIDFTADISLDQLNEQKDITDEDVLNHLDEIENIVFDTSDSQKPEENNDSKIGMISLDTSDFVKEDESNESKEKSVVSNSGTKEIIQVTEYITIDKSTSSNDTTNMELDEKVEEPITYDWYENKLAEKEIIIKERLSKVSRVLGISYPCYEQWLEREEKTNGSPLCKLKPARRCCLKKPYTNRWKFICCRKRVQDSPKKTSDADTSFTKNTETSWKLEASGAWGANINNESEFPPFVLRAVKIFEEFLQTTEQPSNQESVNENFSDDISVEMETKKEVFVEGRQEWSWLLVRCNSMDELMLFATGRNISRATMDRLKQVYESGPGKDCNVKSLYCKSTNKCDDTTVTDTTFLVGSEALDEVVGGLKVQLAPKTNFWSNTAGAENVANAVMDLLAPHPKSILLEIGCGIGLIGLMMASKCQQVIGVDSPSEVEEAEMTCELNNIKNASFIMGSPSEVISKIVPAVKNRKTCAVINANTNLGRAIEVMTCLRKIPSLKRIVMITTLTKQSVRAILELARPVDNINFGSPFIPIMACVVDTLPLGPHFEAVILLQRRVITKLNQWNKKNTDENVKTPETKNAQIKIDEQSINGADKKILNKETEIRTKRNFIKSFKYPAKKTKMQIKNPIYTKSTENVIVKNKFKGKRPHSPDRSEAPPKKVMKKFAKFGTKSWQMDLSTKKKKEWTTENSQLRINPLHEKKLREHKEQTDLRKRLSSNRFDPDIAQTVKVHQDLLEMAKEKLSGPTPTVDVNTAKQLQNMLNMVLEQTNKLQSQLPRSVWDRIAPPENMNVDQRDLKLEDPLLKGRYVQEVGSQDILITTSNKKCSNNEEPVAKPFYKKYNNLPPLEPNTVMPVGPPTDYRTGNPFRTSPERYHETDMQQQTEENPWNLDNTSFERNRWNEMGNMRKLMSPMRRQTSPIKHRVSPQRFSPKRPLLSPPRRPCSPPRRHFSPICRPSSPYRQRSPLRRQMSPPLRRPMSPSRRMSPTRRLLSPRRSTSSPRRNEIMMNRPISPLRRELSPPRRQMSQTRTTMSPPRRQLSPMRRQMSPPRRQILSPNRMISSNRQEMLLSKRQTMPQEKQQMRRAESPCGFAFGRTGSSPRRQQSPHRRQMSPQQRYVDDWDIPSRGAIEQNTWSRSVERMAEQNMWQNEKPSTSNNSWDQTLPNDRRRKTFSQEKWDFKVFLRDDMRNSGANNWNSKPMIKETWPSSSDNRWSSTSNVAGSSNDNWNIRGKESFNARKESWMDKKKQGKWESVNVKDSWKQSDKEDLDDLPEDARDPWGDDGNVGLKERCYIFENPDTSSSWKRESEQQGDGTWSKQKDNWQSKGLPFSTKPQWQNNGMQNVEGSRWIGKNTGSWQSQHSNFQPRSFSTTQFKGLH